MVEKKEQGENDYVKDAEVTLKNIRIDKMDGERIGKITFETEKGNITWKPKVDHKEFQNGMEIHEKLIMKVSELPEKLLKIASTLQEKGTLRLKVSYALFTTERDGEEVTYRYIPSLKVLDTQWELL